MATNVKKDFGNNRPRKTDLTTLVYGRIPPQSPELEEAVLGAIMLEKYKLEDVISIVPTEDVFYVDANQKVYKAILDLHNESYPVDLLTVTDRLRKNSELEIVGGAYYLTKLTMSVVSSAHVEAHARIILEKYLSREVIRIAGQAISSAYDDDNDVFDLLNITEIQLAELQQTMISGDAEHIGKLSAKVTKDVVEQRENNIETTGIPTGYRELDRVIKGLRPGEVSVIAARPGVGKTAIALEVANNAAAIKKPVAFFSLEMSYRQLVARMQAAQTNVPLSAIMQPIKMTDAEYVKYQGADGQMNKLPIYIDDNPNLTVQSLRAKARKLKNKYDIELIIIDYLQLMTSTSKVIREQQIAEISREVKKLSKELDVHIIELSQLSRAAEDRNETPKLSHLRESGSIEQDADIVWLMYRPTKVEEAQAPETKGAVNINIAKNRHGDIEEIILYFEREVQKFHNESPYNKPFQEFKEWETPVNHHKFIQHAADNKSKAANDNNSIPYTNDEDAPF